MYDIDRSLLARIDALDLSERNKRWRAAMKAAPWRVYVDRERLAVESWKETEGEDLEIRTAKMLKKVMDNVPIRIHEFDEIVGRATPGVIGCQTAINTCGDYIHDIWNDDGVIGVTLDASAYLTKEELEVLREAVRIFEPNCMPRRTYEAWRELVGDWAEQAEAAKLKDPGLQNGITGQSTSTLDWPNILPAGLKAYIRRCQEHIDAYIASGGTDVNKVYFWRASMIVLQTVIDHSRRYAALAREMAEQTKDEAEKARLLRIAETCEYVPENPPRTFHEALQFMEMCSLGKYFENPMQNNSHWGRADQYLYGYFKNDLAAGVPLEEIASDLADMIGRWGTQTFVSDDMNKETHQINFGINNVMVGGLGQDHTDMSNELSYLILHVVALLKLSSPTVGLRWNSQTPEYMMEKAIRTNLETRGGIPLFQNDEIMIARYMDAGIPYEEACEWRGLGCVYPCLPNRAEHYGAEGVAAYNLAGVLHLTLHNGTDINGTKTGIETGNPRTFATFDELYEAFFRQHKALIYRGLWLGAVARDIAHEFIRTPLLSILGIEASMDLGQDLTKAHPDHSMFGVSDRAIIDVADSLLAVKHLVYDRKVLTMDELMDALDSNFAGERGEEIRQMCLREPKYGNDIPEADEMVKRISDRSASVIYAYDNSPFPNMIISREGLAWHYFGGLGAGALPNGRPALEPLNDGSLSPMRGADKNGPTAVLRSAMASGYSRVCCAAVLNQKFNSSLLASDESIAKLVAYTNAYMSAGGSHIQYNILDTEQLKDAKENPENYQDLIVRIGGFSAYFVQLSKGIQDDVIYRSEFEI
ncbi:MAG: hypothetical protein IK082_07825 [Oscillospiraceae bacterium]|nr:hypothetical protein [Oscillospiraceae bacterium]